MRDGDRFIQHEVFTFLVLLQRLALHDHVDEWFCRTVEDGRLTRIDLDEHVVDSAAVQSTQNVLNLMDLSMARRNCGVANKIADEIYARLDFWLAVEVNALER